MGAGEVSMPSIRDVTAPHVTETCDGEVCTVRAGRMGGKPCVEGTRVETAAIWGMVQRGHTPVQIVLMYPSLGLGAIHSAILFEALREARRDRDIFWRFNCGEEFNRLARRYRIKAARVEEIVRAEADRGYRGMVRRRR
jgi:uncharacterized protein (DUF433 family)